jgi:hypothetical protein
MMEWKKRSFATIVANVTVRPPNAVVIVALDFPKREVAPLGLYQRVSTKRKSRAAALMDR